MGRANVLKKGLCMPSLIVANVGASALFILVYVTAWFFAALALRRNDVADVAWGLGPALLSWWLLLRPGSPRTPAMILVTLLVTVWGVRLAYHVARRGFHPGVGEDPRYAAWRAEWRFFVLRSYVQVFLLQGFFMLIISLPVILVASWPVSGDTTAVVAGVILWLAGFTFELVGDEQLARYLAEPLTTRAPVMDRGLWAWTRHPNYFGESVMWWGLGVAALSVPYGWIGLASPITITWLLVAISGIPPIERRHSGDPDWQAYRERTSAFLPRPPRGR